MKLLPIFLFILLQTFFVRADDFVNIMHNYYSRQDSFMPKNFIVFLGDSLIQGLPIQFISPCVINYGIGGQTSKDLLKNSKDYKSLKNAHSIFILVGINDILNDDPRSLPNNLSKIISSHSSTSFIINSILPVIRKDLDNKIIEKYNSALSKMCAKKKNCYFHNNYDLFLGENGAPKKKYYRDGTHLTIDGTLTFLNDLSILLKNKYPNFKHECNNRN